MKRKACADLGIDSFPHELPATASQQEVETLVKNLNADPKVHGILVQLPLPAGLDEEAVLKAISIEKDVDGFHPINIGRLAQKGREPLFVPCTPAGCLVLLKKAGAKLSGSQAVVVGRSQYRRHARGAVAGQRGCHRHHLPLAHQDLPGRLPSGGYPDRGHRAGAEMIKGDWIKPGAYVIDVGTNRVDDPSTKSGSRLVGDVAYAEAVEVAGAITPVPGGVGPMTITLFAAEHAALRPARRLADARPVEPTRLHTGAGPGASRAPLLAPGLRPVRWVSGRRAGR